MRIGNGEVIDSIERGNEARFINHSCQPNCITRKWNFLGETTVGVFALRDIAPGEELTFDYKFDVYSTPLSLCLCNSANCKGYLGLRPTEDEWKNKINSLPCTICN